MLTFRIQTFKYIGFVIPAKAGIHHLRSNFKQGGLDFLGPVMDSRLRGNDDVLFQKVISECPHNLDPKFGALRLMWMRHQLRMTAASILAAHWDLQCRICSGNEGCGRFYRAGSLTLLAARFHPSFAPQIGEGKILQKTTLLDIILRRSFAKCQNGCQSCQLGVNLMPIWAFLALGDVGKFGPAYQVPKSPGGWLVPLPPRTGRDQPYVFRFLNRMQGQSPLSARFTSMNPFAR